jgi:hypothetical protein
VIATYHTRLYCIVMSGNHAGSFLDGGRVSQTIDCENCPELFMDGGPAEIVSHEALVRITRSKSLTEIWQSRGFTDQQIKEIRYYRKDGPCDGRDDAQRFLLSGEAITNGRRKA